MIKKIDHIGIAVHSIEKSLVFYTEVLNLPLLAIEDVDSENVRVAFLQAGDTKLELLEPTNFESAIYKYLEKRGEGIHHVALGVESIEKRIEEMKEKGIRMINDVPKVGAGGANVAFMHPKSTGGILYEFCEKKGLNKKS